MVRLARIPLPEIPYHVTQRGKTGMTAWPPRTIRLWGERLKRKTARGALADRRASSRSSSGNSDVLSGNAGLVPSR